MDELWTRLGMVDRVSYRPDDRADAAARWVAAGSCAV